MTIKKSSRKCEDVYKEHLSHSSGLTDEHVRQINHYIQQNYKSMCSAIQSKYFNKEPFKYELQAEDVFHKAVHMLFQYIPKADPDKFVCAETYVYKAIMQNAFYCFMDNKRKRAADYSRRGSLISESNTLIESFENSIDRLTKDTLSSIDKATLKMIDDGLSVAEIKAKLGITSNRQYYSYKERLAKKIQKIHQS